MSTTTTPPPGSAPKQPMTSQDLAAFVAMLFWMHDQTAPTYTPYPSFAAQTAAIMAAVGNATLPPTNLFLNFQTLVTDPTLGPLLTNTQLAFGSFIQAVVASGSWEVCSSVSLDQVAGIAQL